MIGAFSQNRRSGRGENLFVSGESTKQRTRSAGLASCSVLALALLMPQASAQTAETDITTNTTLSSPITIPPGYTQLDYGIGNGATLTLAPGSDPTSTIYLKSLTGGGTIVNNTTITTTGPAIAYDPYYSMWANGVSILNNGTIISTVASGKYALSVDSNSYADIINTGTITALGAGIAVFTPTSSTLINSGLITATGTAVYAGGGQRH